VVRSQHLQSATTPEAPRHLQIQLAGTNCPKLGGRLSTQGNTKPTFKDLRQAVVHGSVTASYTCEAFSTHKLQKVTKADIAGRLAELQGYTSFQA
jgi:hypothetical protein